MNDVTLRAAESPMVPRGTNEAVRIVAEVQASITVAQARPRDVARAMASMKHSCEMTFVAEVAFYRYNRGGEQITGPTIQLAQELARSWGNVSYGVRELRRLDGESEMMAFAWDLETNVRADTTFMVPHVRDKKTGRVELTDARDIYETNANNAARRLREMIMRVLPPWYREAAIEACHKTLEKGKTDAPLPVRVNTMLEAFSKIGVTRARIEARLGSNANEMTPVDLAQLGIAFRAIQRGESSKEIEFPTIAAMDVARKLAEEDADATASSGPGG